MVVAPAKDEHLLGNYGFKGVVTSAQYLNNMATERMSLLDF